MAHRSCKHRTTPPARMIRDGQVCVRIVEGAKVAASNLGRGKKECPTGSQENQSGADATGVQRQGQG